jgi:hypothetical protein
VHDNDPAKYVMCVRDIMTGIVLPWHLDSIQKQRIQAIIDNLDNALQDRSSDDLMLIVIDNCLEQLTNLTIESKSIKNTYEKFERAKFSITHIKTSLKKLLS